MNQQDRTMTLSYCDLIDMRDKLQFWVADLSFSDQFRALCEEVVRAIGQCSEADTTTHHAVVVALENLGVAYLDEAIQQTARDNLFAKLDAVQDIATWRRILGELVPLLSDAHILGVRALMLDAAADFPASASVN